MNYQVLARKWRPQNFIDMVGQDHISSTLCNAINNQRVGHAYLFVGTRGTGKTTTARIFAKALNCERPLADANPCDECNNCLEITAGSCMDVLEIDGASNNGVDDIRRLRDNVQYTPARCKFKIYIIDEVHMLSTAAWNALLKTLEEPPDHVKFFFATTEAHKVLPTILSRCQRFDLKRIPQGTIAKRLQFIAGEEQASFEPSALNAIARAANGGMRDALSIMDQMIAFCSNQQIISENDISEVFGLTSNYDLAKITAAILTDDASALVREINRLADLGRNLEQLYSDLLHFSRNLMICSISGNEASSILDLDEQELSSAFAIAAQTSPETLQKLVDGFLIHDGKLRNTLNKRIFLEMTLIRIMKDAHAVSLNDILKRINHLRKGGSLDFLEEEIPTTAKNIELQAPAATSNTTATEQISEITTPIEPINEIPHYNEQTSEIVVEAAPNTQLVNESVQEVAPNTQLVSEVAPEVAPNTQLVNEVAPEVAPNTQLASEVLPDNKPINESAHIEGTTTDFQQTEINDSYEIPYSTLIDSETIDRERFKDPLGIGNKKFQGNFDPENETSSSQLGLYYSAPSTVNESVSTNTEVPQQQQADNQEAILDEVKAQAPTQQTIETVTETASPETVLQSPVNTQQDNENVQNSANTEVQVHENIQKPVNTEDSRYSSTEPPQRPAIQVPTQPDQAPQKAPLAEPTKQSTTDIESAQQAAQKLWHHVLETAKAEPSFHKDLQNFQPVSYQQPRFYAAFNHQEENPQLLQKLQEHIRLVSQNPNLEIKMLKANLKEEGSQHKSLTASEEVWQRVNNNPLFRAICNEFNGKIIDVRG